MANTAPWCGHKGTGRLLQQVFGGKTQALEVHIIKE